MITSVVIAVLVISAAASAWEVNRIHLPNPAEVTSRRVVVLESADGRYLQPYWGGPRRDVSIEPATSLASARQRISTFRHDSRAT